MCALIIMVLWTWGLTPVWVNIVGTVLMACRWLSKIDIPDSKDKEDE